MSRCTEIIRVSACRIAGSLVRTEPEATTGNEIIRLLLTARGLVRAETGREYSPIAGFFRPVDLSARDDDTRANIHLYRGRSGELLTNIRCDVYPTSPEARTILTNEALPFAVGDADPNNPRPDFLAANVLHIFCPPFPGDSVPQFAPARETRFWVGGPLSRFTWEQVGAFRRDFWDPLTLEPSEAAVLPARVVRGWIEARFREQAADLLPFDGQHSSGSEDDAGEIGG